MRVAAFGCAQLLIVITFSTASRQEHESVRLTRLGPYGLLQSPVQGYQSILNSFDIRTNTIIRTNDSLRAGAKYLSERQLRNSGECSLYCWEVPSCNVAVFEEKSNGGCYVFDCGAPENFACQFTTHDAYTVLLLSTRSQHESELVSLKHVGHGHGEVQDERSKTAQRPPQLGSATPTSSPSSSTSTSSGSTTATTTTSVTTSPTTTTSTRKPEAARCVEHQFRCLNSSECIAIYDVCNGIPQCADGSDEAETLDCHSRDRQRMLKQPVELTDNQIYEIVRPLQEKLQEKEEAVYRHPGVYEETHQRKYPPYRGDIYRGNQAVDYNDVYPSRRFSTGLFSQQQDFQPSRYEDGQAGISGGNSYGGGSASGGIYHSATAMQRGYDNAPDFPTNYYPYARDRGSAYGGNILGGLPGDQGEKGLGSLDSKASLFGAPRYAPGGASLTQQQKSEKQLQMAKAVNTNIVREPLSSLEQAKSTQRTEGGSPPGGTAGGSSEAKPRRRPGKFMDEASPPPRAAGGPQPATSSGTVRENAATSKPEPGPPAKQIGNMANMHISVTQVETKNTSSTTSGAVVGLALGVCMSTLFLLVVGCRLNMRRRLSRWRRGGSKKGLSLLAPEDDEDYLVNGMYL